MAVPSGNYLVNTAGGAFSAITEGGTILGNDYVETINGVVTYTDSAISKRLGLKDNAVTWSRGTLPMAQADSANNGLHGAQQTGVGGSQTAGTFAYSAGGKYVIASSSDTLSGVSSTKALITGRGADMNAILRFHHSFGAKTVTAFRLNRFSWTHTKSHSPAQGTPSARHNWLDVATAGMSAASGPAALNENMWDPVADALSANSDSAANPTRAVPGELVMKVDFVTLGVGAGGGDFFDYAPITGM